MHQRAYEFSLLSQLGKSPPTPYDFKKLMTLGFRSDRRTLERGHPNLYLDSGIGIASRLCGCLDALPSFRCRPDATPPSSSDGLNLVVVLATVRTPDSLDTRLRRLGRFAREVAIGAPDRAAREAILDAALPRLRDHDVALQDVVRATPGWVGADLVALADEAGAVCARRVSAWRAAAAATDGTAAHPAATEKSVFVALPNGANMPPSPLLVTHADVLRALTTVEPCFGRSGFSRAPDVDWKDVCLLYTSPSPRD